MEFRISPQISGKIAWHSFKLNVAENEVSVSLEAWQARRLPSDGSPALVSISQKVQLSGGGTFTTASFVGRLSHQALGALKHILAHVTEIHICMTLSL